MEKAKADSNYLMDNLQKADIIDRFPEKYFPRDKFRPFLLQLTDNCDLANKQGKFVDYFSMLNNGKTQYAFIYEYIMDCDSLRFIYTYDLETEKPELFHFKIEGLEVPSNMIIDPSKQLLYKGEK